MTVGRQFKLEAASGEASSPSLRIAGKFDRNANAIVHKGDSLDFLRTLPDESVSLVISSPPYNVGKEYEVQTALETYLDAQKPVLHELVRVLRLDGSLCWQVGNYVEKSEVFPLDLFYYPLFKKLGLRLRNRVIWHFGHGLHASKRFSGRYESLLWFTKTDKYTFNLDAVRVPSKYPGKTYYSGKKRGQPSGNPLGKNPSDFWGQLEEDWDKGLWDFPNVKSNHPEKTVHPCQFPVELVERCVLAFTNEDEFVLDPYGGVGSAVVGALMHKRRGIMVDREQDYVDAAFRRIAALEEGKLRTRKMGTPVYQPSGREKVSQVPVEWTGGTK